MWYEELPERCPPEDAFHPNGVYFRLTESEKIECSDFWSHRKKWPTKMFQVCECRARSVSVFDDIEQCLNVRKLPNQKQKKIVSVQLSNGDGVIKQTGKNTSHYSWWRSDTFDVNSAQVVAA